jgi:hypothetical protein
VKKISVGDGDMITNVIRVLDLSAISVDDSVSASVNNHMNSQAGGGVSQCSLFLFL